MQQAQNHLHPQSSLVGLSVSLVVCLPGGLSLVGLSVFLEKSERANRERATVSCALQNKQLHALAVLSRCWPAQSQTGRTDLPGGLSLVGLFVFLEKSERANRERAR